MLKQAADDWFVGFQDGLKAQFWRAVSEPWADDDATAIAALLDLPAGARVLDAPCGAGRIAVRLAQRGLRVTGIDISEVEIVEARRSAARRGVDAHFMVCDVREAPAQDYDALVMWGNSFGYTPHAETVRHLEASRRALRVGGRLVLETLTVAELMLPRLSEKLDYDLGNVRMRARHNYDAVRSRQISELRFTAPGSEPETATVIHHVHTVAELVRLLEAAGFEVEDLLGDPAARTPFELGSKRLIVMARAR